MTSPKLLLLISIAFACGAGILSTPRSQAGRRPIDDLIPCLLLVALAIVLLPIDARYSLLSLDLVALLLVVFGPRSRVDGPGGLSLNRRVLLSVLLMGSVLGIGGLLGVADLRSFDTGVTGVTIPELALKLRLGLTGSTTASIACVILLISMSLRFMAIRPVADDRTAVDSHGSRLAGMIVCLMPPVAAIHAFEFREMLVAVETNLAAALAPLLGLWIAMEGWRQLSRAGGESGAFPVRFAAQQTCLILMAVLQTESHSRLAGFAIAVLASMELLALMQLDQINLSRNGSHEPAIFRRIILCSQLGIPFAARLYLESTIVIGVWRLGTSGSFLAFVASVCGLLMMKLWILGEVTNRVLPVSVASDRQSDRELDSVPGGRVAVLLAICAGVLLIQLAIPFWMNARTQLDSTEVGRAEVAVVPVLSSRFAADSLIRIAQASSRPAGEVRGAE